MCVCFVDGVLFWAQGITPVGERSPVRASVGQTLKPAYHRAQCWEEARVFPASFKCKRNANHRSSSTYDEIMSHKPIINGKNHKSYMH